MEDRRSRIALQAPTPSSILDPQSSIFDLRSSILDPPTLRLNPFDLRADRAQFLFNFLVPAIDVIDAVDQGLAFSRESGQDQRGRGAKVGGDQLRAGQTG